MSNTTGHYRIEVGETGCRANITLNFKDPSKTELAFALGYTPRPVGWETISALEEDGTNRRSGQKHVPHLDFRRTITDAIKRTLMDTLRKYDPKLTEPPHEFAQDLAVQKPLVAADSNVGLFSISFKALPMSNPEAVNEIKTAVDDAIKQFSTLVTVTGKIEQENMRRGAER